MDSLDKHSASNSEYADISLIGLSRVIRRYKFIVVGAFVLSLGISILTAIFSTPVYRSSIIISPVSGGGGIGGQFSRLLQGFGGNVISGNTGASRNSRAVSLSALSSPFFIRAYIEDQNLRPVLFADAWDPVKGEWQHADPNDIPTLSDAYELFTGDIIRVEEDSGSGVVTITVDWTDPALAAEWANGLVFSANERLRSQAIEDADLTIKYLNQELANTNAVELQQALYFLVENEIQTRTMAKVQKEYAFKVLSPAVQADIDKPVKPNRLFIISIGAALGLIGGIFLAILMGAAEGIVKDIRNDSGQNH